MFDIWQCGTSRSSDKTRQWASWGKYFNGSRHTLHKGNWLFIDYWSFKRFFICNLFSLVPMQIVFSFCHVLYHCSDYVVIFSQSGPEEINIKYTLFEMVRCCTVQLLGNGLHIF